MKPLILWTSLLFFFGSAQADPGGGLGGSSVPPGLTQTVADTLYAPMGIGGADNLGNHIATKTLDMAGFGVSNAGAIGATGFTGPLTGAASSNVLKAGDTMTGSLVLQSSSTVSNHEVLVVKNNAGSKILHIHEGDGFSFFVDTVTIKSNGRVGIGTGTPTAQLDLVGTDFPVYKTTRLTAVTNSFASANMFLTQTSGQMADGFGGGLVYGGQDADGVQNMFASVGAVRDGADNSGALYLNTYVAGAVQLGRVVVKANGNVGIGITSPGTTLHVVGSATVTGAATFGSSVTVTGNALSVGDGVTSAAVTIKLDAPAANWMGTSLYKAGGTEKWFIGMGDFATHGDKLLFRRAASTNDLVIDTAGKVGIGTSSPVTKLQVGVGNTSADTAIAKFNTTDTDVAALELSNWDGAGTSFGPRIHFDNSGVGNWYIGSANGANNFDIATTWGTPMLRVTSGGNVAVRTTGSKLIMTSPDGTCSACGPDNSDVWACASVACP